MPRRSIIWLATNLDSQVVPVWMVSIAQLALSEPQLGSAYLWHAQQIISNWTVPTGTSNLADGLLRIGG